ncbi:hypothetical protein BCR34DRAFT_614298 [Clohesyomyces aquaticus]|uniref:Uncharacterized protein n=1 Tax=Clohesyomyces aquaticus TaxID=1231657 RepID=A0A1Y1ZNQ4_9PLEO|nr:hypothetical protein BCR34DRAFT_614298 [Clohesyomyces aquaticus]
MSINLWTAIHRRLPSTVDFHLPSTSIYRQLPSTVNFHLPSTSIYRQLPSTVNFHLPSTSIYRQLPSTVDVHPPSTPICHRGLSAAKPEPSQNSRKSGRRENRRLLARGFILQKEASYWPTWNFHAG